MEINIVTLFVIIILAALAFAAIYASRTIFVRMQRRLELAEATHAQAMKTLETEHDERLQRLQRDAEQSQRYAHHKLVLEVLPVIDALDQASKFTTDSIPATIPSTPQPAIHHGVQLAKQQLLQALNRHGIEYITPSPGDVFEPLCHEAVHIVEDDKLEAGQIARCLRAGFRQDERVLRSAMVEVVTQPASQSSEAPLEASSPTPSPTIPPPSALSEPEPSTNETSAAEDTSAETPTPRNVGDTDL